MDLFSRAHPGSILQSVEVAVRDREIEELERLAPPVPEATVLEALYLQRGLLEAKSPDAMTKRAHGATGNGR